MDDTKSNSSGTNMSRPSSFGLALASSTFSEPSKQASVFSAFGDRDCGEPLETHHIHLDFTPTSDDHDFSQRKCCEFWKYITSRRDLHGMIVRPEIMKATASSTDASTAKPRPSSPDRGAKPKTAVSMLQIVEDKGLIDRAFEAKMQQSRCSLGSHEYELDTAEQTKAGSAKRRPSPPGTKYTGLQKCLDKCRPYCCSITVETYPGNFAAHQCPCPGPCLKCPGEHASAQALCDELGAWDVCHPKSMEPPGHAPSIYSPSASIQAKPRHLAKHHSCDDPNPSDAVPSRWVCPRSLSSAFECECKEGYHYDEEMKKCVMNEDCTELQPAE